MYIQSLTRQVGARDRWNSNEQCNDDEGQKQTMKVKKQMCIDSGANFVRTPGLLERVSIEEV